MLDANKENDSFIIQLGHTVFHWLGLPIISTAPAMKLYRENACLPIYQILLQERLIYQHNFDYASAILNAGHTRHICVHTSAQSECIFRSTLFCTSRESIIGATVIQIQGCFSTAAVWWTKTGVLRSKSISNKLMLSHFSFFNGYPR